MYSGHEDDVGDTNVERSVCKHTVNRKSSERCSSTQCTSSRSLTTCRQTGHSTVQGVSHVNTPIPSLESSPDTGIGTAPACSITCAAHAWQAQQWSVYPCRKPTTAGESMQITHTCCPCPCVKSWPRCCCFCCRSRCRGGSVSGMGGL